MAYALNSDLDDEHREEIQCAACSRMFEDPTTLPCRHSFCKVCLADIVGRHRNEESLDRVFSCPECGSEFILKSDETVANVQPTSDEVKETAELDPGSGIPCAHECESQSVARCVTCEKYLCRECLTAHNNYRGNKGHSVLSVEGLSKHKNHLKKERKMFCSKFGHENRALKFYCETCETFICRYCMDFSHEKQEGHICRLAKEVAQKNRDSLVASYANLKNLLEEGETFLKQLSFVTKKVEKHAEDAKTEFAERKQTIVKWFSDSLEKRSKKLNAEIDEIQGRKLQTLKQHEDKTKRYVTSIQECVQTSTQLLDETTDEDIISLQKLAKESEEKLGQQRSTYFKLPVTDLDVHYSDFTIRSPSMDAILDQAKLLMGKIRVPDDIPNPELQIVEFKRPSNYESEKISQVVEAQDHLRYQPRATASSNENTSQKAVEDLNHQTGPRSKRKTGLCAYYKNSKLMVYEGDLKKEKADVIVMPITRERYEEIKRFQRIGFGDVVICHEKNLPCGMVLYAIFFKPEDEQNTRPQRIDFTLTMLRQIVFNSLAEDLPCGMVLYAIFFKPEDEQNTRPQRIDFPLTMLRQIVFNSLAEASEHKAKIVSMTTTGLQLSVEECAENIFDAVEDFLERSNESIQEIRFVNGVEQTSLFSNELVRRYQAFETDVLDCEESTHHYDTCQIA